MKITIGLLAISTSTIVYGQTIPIKEILNPLFIRDGKIINNYVEQNPVVYYVKSSDLRIIDPDQDKINYTVTTVDSWHELRKAILDGDKKDFLVVWIRLNEVFENELVFEVQLSLTNKDKITKKVPTYGMLLNTIIQMKFDNSANSWILSGPETDN